MLEQKKPKSKFDSTLTATKVLACFPEGTSNNEIKETLQDLLDAIKFGAWKNMVIEDVRAEFRKR